MTTDIAAFSRQLDTIPVPEKIRQALKAATKPGTTTDANMRTAMAELAVDDRRDAMLAATPMGCWITAAGYFSRYVTASALRRFG